MLPHYSPYKVAEQFKIMAARHPQRIDMAIGRSPSFKNVNAALNENKMKNYHSILRLLICLNTSITIQLKTIVLNHY